MCSLLYRLKPSLCSMESLRIFPPVPMTVRQAAKSDFVDGVWVPKGTLFYIAVSMQFLHKCNEADLSLLDSGYQYIQGILGRRRRRVDTTQSRDMQPCLHKKYRFRPERWSELEQAPEYHPTHSFQTFINGPHHCIGKTMAIVEMKAVLASVLPGLSSKAILI